MSAAYFLLRGFKSARSVSHLVPVRAIVGFVIAEYDALHRRAAMGLTVPVMHGLLFAKRRGFLWEFSTGLFAGRRNCSSLGALGEDSVPAVFVG